jgi:hypothetical protein
MWIGSIRLIVETKDAPFAGTDSLVQATILRDGTELRVLNLDYPTENDLECFTLTANQINLLLSVGIHPQKMAWAITVPVRQIPPLIESGDIQKPTAPLDQLTNPFQFRV